MLRNKNAETPKRNNPVADLTFSSSHAVLRKLGIASNFEGLSFASLDFLEDLLLFLSSLLEFADLRTLRTGLSLGLEEVYKVRMMLICKNKRFL